MRWPPASPCWRQADSCSAWARAVVFRRRPARSRNGFPTKERATAMGIINAGTAVGAVVAPPLIATILVYSNWRWIFVLTGGIGSALDRMVAIFVSLHRSSHVDRTLDTIRRLRLCGQHLPWIHLFRIRETWGLVTAKFLSDAAWFFYLFWLPKYLYDARGFDIKAVGTFAWMPSAAAGVGCLLGGAFSSYLLRRKFSLGVARKVGARTQRCPHALRDSDSSCCGFVGNRALLPRLLRTAVLVNSGHGSPDGSLPSECRWFGCRTSRFWRSHGRNRRSAR